ncbi:dynein axonemal intermediate chain 4 isoform X1 [Patella vulgata]|uniref:dynein axonemal intermediate chain 4 isoform X1 n=1 Tax=Patella vulgata TaxID=6465 RepID=UPI0021808D02|nr:dynein axonemal intermediate chain 4 isoform X1 [Patella vulgata]
MSTSKNKKHLNAPTPNPNASMKKGTLTHSVTRSKYGGGGVRNTTFASSRSNIVSSASRKSMGAQTGDKSSHIRPPVQVFDETGIDVTPIPLQQTDPNVMKKNQSNILGDSTAGTPSDLLSQNSFMYTTGTASIYGGFSRSVFSQSYDTGSGMDEIAEPSQEHSSWADIQFKREETKEIVTDSDLEKTVDLNLSETETIWLLDMPDICVFTESEEAPSIRTRNEKYLELTKSRAGNDRYAERGMNTFNEPPKLKQIQTTKIQSNDIGIMATTWDMHDTYEALDKENKVGNEDDEEEGTISRPSTPKSGEEKTDAEKETEGTTSRGSSARMGSMKNSTMMDSRATMVSSTAGSESVFAGGDTSLSATIQSELQAMEEEKIMKSENLKRDLFNMERVINLNTYQPKQALYRGFSVMTDIDKEVSNVSTITGSDMGPNLDRLWSYTCPLTKGRNVSSMSWNKVNPDLIAIGYGQFEFTNQKAGYVCCWSLKNPEFPERVFTCKEGVTAVDFSTANPNLLAVGFYDGSVAIYNVKSNLDEPIVESVECQGKHTAPVWQVKWIEKERGSGEEGTEVIISVSTDGRVTQWSVRKGFESYDLMRLKKMPTRMAGRTREKKGGAFICGFAGGLTFDFHSRDTNIYLAGTEEGYIHKCSCSYNEQYLESYTGHTGPVYKIQWSPFVPDIFLSCSADWSIRLWHQDRVKPVLSFFSSTKAVNDLCWSPRSSTVFTCVNEGAVEVWDLNTSTLDPLIINNPTSGAKQTSVTFARNSECILVGDSEGQVTVYQLRCMPTPPEDPSEALMKVIGSSITIANQLQSQETSKALADPEDEFSAEDKE